MAIFNTGRYLPGVGARDHSQNDYLLKVLAPLVVSAALCFSAYDSLFFWGDREIPTTPPQLILWILVPSAAGWLAFLLFRGRSLYSAHRAASSLRYPSACCSCRPAPADGLVRHRQSCCHPPRWAEYVTIAPPLLMMSFDLGAALFMGLSSRALDDEDREWLARSSAWTQLFCVSWLVVCGLVLLVPGWAFGWAVWAKSALTAVGGISGWLAPAAAARASGGSKPRTAGTGAVCATVHEGSRPSSSSSLCSSVFQRSPTACSTSPAWSSAPPKTKAGQPVDWWDHDDAARAHSLVLGGRRRSACSTRSVGSWRATSTSTNSPSTACTATA